MFNKIILFLLITESLAFVVRLSEDECDPTPLNLENNFTTSCGDIVQDSDTCDSAWSTFAGSFANKDPTTVTPSDYEPYFDVLPIEVEDNQSLFWSGTFELVGLVSCMCSTGADVVSSTNTPSSEIINELGDINWCGVEGGGIQYEGSCPCSVTTNFWVQFSTEFAQAARGTIFYLGYGERNGGTFQSTSFFATVEIPNLEYPRVTSAVVIVVHRKGEGESCGEGTLITLKNTLNEKNLAYSCYNVFGDLMDESQTQALSVCSSKIVTAEQEGMEPEPDSCFEKGGSGALIGEMWIIVLALMITFMYGL